MGETYVPKEPNDWVQLDFWDPVNYVRGRMKYVLVAVDTFSHWPSAYVCSSNKSKNVLKFLRKYINTNGHPRKLHMDQATGFFSNEIQNECRPFQRHSIVSTGCSICWVFLTTYMAPVDWFQNLLYFMQSFANKSVLDVWVSLIQQS